jgi:hypothetical protein
VRPRAAGVALLAAAALGGCGSDEQPAGELHWTAKPRVFTHPTLRSDRILTGTVRNDGLRPVEVKAREVRLVDSDGRPLQSTAVFVRGYLHGLYPPTRPPAGGVPEREQQRTGDLLKLAPGRTAPLTLSWRLRPGAKPPVRADYPGGSLPIPSG